MLAQQRVVIPFFEQRPQAFVSTTGFGCSLEGHTRDIIQRFVYIYGVWEPRMTRWLQRRLRPGDGFIDVGANVGYYSLLAAKLVGETGTVIALEPSPKIYRALERNLTLYHAAMYGPSG